MVWIVLTREEALPLPGNAPAELLLESMIGRARRPLEPLSVKLLRGRAAKEPLFEQGALAPAPHVPIASFILTD